MQITRKFTTSGKNPFDSVEWGFRDSTVYDSDGNVISQMRHVEVPTTWSQLAVDIIVSKYFRKAGVPQLARLEENPVLEQDVDDNGYLMGVNQDGEYRRILGSERSARQVIHRLALAWTTAGRGAGYFDAEDDADAFYDEICYMLLHQMFAPNSPQWFNTGLYDAYGIVGQATGRHYYADEYGTHVCDNAYERPQVSACFIQGVSDSLLDDDGIFSLFTREAAMFKYGSGTGTNFSPLRAKNEPLSSGGKSSGLMSWLKIADAAAGAIKSGGTTRRAAKMVVLDIDHPDIETFIGLKVREELKVSALVNGAGMWNAQDKHFADRLGLNLTYDFNGEAYGTVDGQNANYSVRIPDSFMSAVDGGDYWTLTPRVQDESVPPMLTPNLYAPDLWNFLCECAWRVGDPGVQYDDTINAWHTCKNSGRINASNPCCFIGETLVDTSEGRIRFDELCRMYDEGEELPSVWAFSKKQGVPVLRKIVRVWKAGDAAELVEVLTDKGIRLRCTPDHRFLLRDGRYVQAKDLRAGDRLRKIGRFVNEHRGSRRYLNHKITSSSSNGTTAQARYMWEQVNGPIEEGWDIHHVNGDATDDRLSNLALVWRDDHRKYHTDGSLNPRYIEIDDATLVDVWESIEKLPRLTHKRVQQRVTPTRWNAYVRANKLQGIVPMAASSSREGRIRGMTWQEFSAWIEARRGLVNDSVHSVRAIEPECPVAVYDMEVQGTHNFAVTNEADTGRHTIVVHNSEYLFLDNTACNLASLNLLKFWNEFQTSFEIDNFVHAARLVTMVLDISVGMASYPSHDIAQRSFQYRTLGLGYANLGAMLMRAGIPYDSEEACEVAAAITSVMTGTAYHTSTQLAKQLGSFPHYEQNKNSMRQVILNHARAAGAEESEFVGLMYEPFIINHTRLGDLTNHITNAKILSRYAADKWLEVLEGSVHGFRNAQVTVIAPTGTIGLLMDCDTTGVEPDFALVKFKKLAGGGYVKIMNASVVPALEALGYDSVQIGGIMRHVVGTMDLARTDVRPIIGGNSPTLANAWLKMIGYTDEDIDRVVRLVASTASLDQVLPDGGKRAKAAIGDHAFVRVSRLLYGHHTLEGAPHISEEHLDVFCCANACGDGTRYLSPFSHINMCAAVQPFISGGISKTINLPEDATITDIAHCYKRAWSLGVKCVALYRDKCKSAQPLNTGGSASSESKSETASGVPETTSQDKTTGLQRRRLPATCPSLRHKFNVGGHEGYLHVGVYEDDGRPAEIFIDISKEGSTMAGLLNSIGILISVMLQYGIPLELIVKKLKGMRFEPNGFTGDTDIRFTSSIVDYIARWMETQFIDKSEEPTGEESPLTASLRPTVAMTATMDTPLCTSCGMPTVRNGTCHRCDNCGISLGCS